MSGKHKRNMRFNILYSYRRGKQEKSINNRNNDEKKII